MEKLNHGAFVVLDGNDGSGKATQARLLGDRLATEGISAEKVDFPDFVHMDPKVASSLYALDRLESTPHIRESLENGRVVIADRFSSSNQIHQGGKIGDEKQREVFLTWLDTMEHSVLNIPRPDAIIYLRVPVETSLVLLSEKRKAKNGLADGQKDTVEEDRSYLERSHETAQWLAGHQPNWHIIDCIKDGVLRTPADIHEEVYAALTGILRK
jgi:dTMP kinase